ITTPKFYTLSLHDALPISISEILAFQVQKILLRLGIFASVHRAKRSGNRKDMFTIYIGGYSILEFSKIVKYDILEESPFAVEFGDRKSTRLNSSHVAISYA